MKTALFVLCGCLITSAALGQNMSIATDQAKRASGQGGAPPGGQAQAPSAQQPPPIDPALAATMKNIANLRADFVVISAADAAAAADQRVSLLNNLSAAAQGTKAATANVRQLAGDLINALAGRKKILPQTQKLGGLIHALFNGAHVSDPQQETLLKEVSKILTEAEVPTDDATKVVETLKAIAAETK